jgi:hypothetical protein
MESPTLTHLNEGFCPSASKKSIGENIMNGNIKKRTLAVICATAVMATVCIATPAQKKGATQRAHSTRSASPNKLRQVKVFFQKYRAPEGPGHEYGLYAVTRNVDAKNPARSALQAFLAGPNKSEKNKGFQKAGGGPRLKVGKITISRGVARVDFIHVSGWWAGDIGSSVFSAGVERTLRQFKGVNQVVVSVDGVTNFDPSE